MLIYPRSTGFDNPLRLFKYFDELRPLLRPFNMKDDELIVSGDTELPLKKSDQKLVSPSASALGIVANQAIHSTRCITM